MQNNLEKIFKELENQFDVNEPNVGHFSRFEAKLNKGTKPNILLKLWPFIAIAASVILIFGVWLGASFSKQGMELAKVSSEMGETQNYFVATIEKELEIIEKERNPSTEQIINDGLQQLNKLEIQYQVLTLELKESTEDKRIIYAMIENFQQRIEVLQSLLTQIEDVKQLKIQNNEKFS
ncbi:MAG: hypothetical protein A3F91_04940 [Flavobacteria bacterium RIFCSPLOWO2_12_FULL_35_11]|nr:MAG: hypothetical protein A3F91_04940 [Flavobacteria bacterium RIFCSPLOWO2_12_FULL_35_11]